jgi:hypothetical protein
VKKFYTLKALLEEKSSFKFECNCVDSNGYPKKLYRTFKDAQRAKGNRVWLKIYPCPEKMGFHLSKV